MGFWDSIGSFFSSVGSSVYSVGESLLSGLDWTDIINNVGSAYLTINALSSSFEMPDLPTLPNSSSSSSSSSLPGITSSSSVESVMPATVSQAADIVATGAQNDNATAIIEAEEDKKRQLLAAQGRQSTILTGGLGITDDDVPMTFKTLLGS